MQTFEPEMMSSERGDARSAILQAARIVAQRDGVENLTLSKVATEAELPRPVVYSQFVRKEDLLLCVAADSVVTLARRMGGLGSVEEFTVSASGEGAVILTLPRSEAGNEMLDDVVQSAAAVNQGAVAAGAERRSLRSGDQAEDAPPAGEAHSDKSAGRAPDAWLERRLRVFERAMTTMEQRQERVEKDSRAMVVSAENSIKTLESTLSALMTRLDESEARQKTAVNEVRAALSEASLRIQTVEGVARAALVENDIAADDVAVALPEAPEQLHVESAPEPKHEPESTPTPQAKSFLSAARASAIAAAASVEAEAANPKSKKLDLVSLLPYLVGGLIVLAVFVVAAGIAFSKGVRDGRTDALRGTTLLARQEVPAVKPALAPLDRLTKLAEAGNANAELAIANLYLGSGQSRNPSAGMQWMARAAQQGNAVAQYALGSLYQKGVGTKADPILAMHWYEAAALQGNRKAMHDLAVAYAEGLGGVKSPSESVRWFSRAANLGYVDSEFDLAVLYERGDGVPQSLVDAYKWYAIASAQGDAESKLRQDALRTQLSADDLAAAQRAADAFHPTPFDPAANLTPKI